MTDLVWNRVEGGWYTCDALRKSLVYELKFDARSSGWCVYPWGADVVAGPYATLQAAQDAAADPDTRYVEETFDD